MMQNELFPPFQKSSDTSREAAKEIIQHVSRLESEVLDHIRSCGRYGATCDEICDRTKMGVQTVSARINGLKRKGLIEANGLRRATRSGRSAQVYEVAR